MTKSKRVWVTVCSKAANIGMGAFAIVQAGQHPDSAVAIAGIFSTLSAALAVKQWAYVSGESSRPSGEAL